MKNLERSLTTFLVVMIGAVLIQSARIPFMTSTQIEASIVGNRSPAVVK